MGHLDYSHKIKDDNVYRQDEEKILIAVGKVEENYRAIFEGLTEQIGE